MLLVGGGRCVAKKMHMRGGVGELYVCPANLRVRSYFFFFWVCVCLGEGWGVEYRREVGGGILPLNFSWSCSKISNKS